VGKAAWLTGCRMEAENPVVDFENRPRVCSEQPEILYSKGLEQAAPIFAF